MFSTTLIIWATLLSFTLNGLHPSEHLVCAQRHTATHTLASVGLVFLMATLWSAWSFYTSEVATILICQDLTYIFQDVFAQASDSTQDYSSAPVEPSVSWRKYSWDNTLYPNWRHNCIVAIFEVLSQNFHRIFTNTSSAISSLPCSIICATISGLSFFFLHMINCSTYMSHSLPAHPDTKVGRVTTDQ